jgi:signal peptidase I
VNSSASPSTPLSIPLDVDTSIEPPTDLPPAPPPIPRREPASHHTGFLPAIQSLVYIIIVAIFIITFAAQPFRIPSESMEPTLLVGDFLLVDKQSLGTVDAAGLLPSASIKRGEIIVFHFPIDPKMHLVKRVIGLPGDRIRLHDDRVYINGVALTEPYAVYRSTPPDNFRDNFPRLQVADPEVDFRWWSKMHSLVDHGELIVPPDSYFVLGDNRNDSEDSRYWGLVPRSAIVGKPFLIYFSLQRDAPDAANNIAFHRLNSHAGSTEASFMDALLNFARWGRTLRVVN